MPSPSRALEIILDLTERCDRCAAAAQLLARLRTGGVLTFCGHHANEYAGLIARTATQVGTAEGFVWRGAPQPR